MLLLSLPFLSPFIAFPAILLDCLKAGFKGESESLIFKLSLFLSVVNWSTLFMSIFSFCFSFSLSFFSFFLKPLNIFSSSPYGCNCIIPLLFKFWVFFFLGTLHRTGDIEPSILSGETGIRLVSVFKILEDFLSILIELLGR